MYSRGRQKQSSQKFIYSEEQVKRSLIAAGITITSELENDIMLFCPFHNNFRSPSAEISKDTGVFWCFSCQESKQLPEVIMHVSGRSYFESIRLIDSKGDLRDIDEKIEGILEKNDFKEFDKNLIEKLHRNVFRNKRALEYFDSRNINEESIKKYELGYSENQDMVTIPVHNPNGICLGFVGRSIEGKVFKNTPGLPKSKTMFNLHRAKRYDNVFVVESSFDAIRLEQVGAHAVASLGATVSKEQRNLLKQYFNQIIVLGDNDEAGKNMSNKLISHLGTQKCFAPKLPGDVKDVSELKEEDLKNFVTSLDDIVVSMLQ